MARRRDKPLLFVLCLLPLAWLGALAATGGLGANPIEAVNRFLGDWALRFLLLTLAITPLRRLGDWPALMRYRRMLGLFCFFYAALHLAGYLVLDQFFDWAAIARDIVKRRYILIGMVVFALLLPLAVTSTNRMVQRLGAARWKKLHRLVYPAAILAVLHFALMVKGPPVEPALYGLVLAVLLGLRLVKIRPSARPAAPLPPVSRH
jgi:sulfoxide reductase heme-binding subunit YedZ